MSNYNSYKTKINNNQNYKDIFDADKLDPLAYEQSHARVSAYDPKKAKQRERWVTERVKRKRRQGYWRRHLVDTRRRGWWGWYGYRGYRNWAWWFIWRYEYRYVDYWVNVRVKKTFTEYHKVIKEPKCQKWTAQTPHAHDNTPQNKPNKQLGDHNLCRNPNNAPGGDWCYTTDPSVKWAYCHDDENLNISNKRFAAREARYKKMNDFITDFQSCQQVLAAKQAELQTLENNLNTKKQILQNILATIQTLDNDLNHYQEDIIIALLDKYSNLTDTVARKYGELEECQEDLANIENDLSNCKNDLQPRTILLAKKKLKIEELNLKINELNGEIALLKKEIAKLTKQVKSLFDRLVIYEDVNLDLLNPKSQDGSNNRVFYDTSKNTECINYKGCYTDRRTTNYVSGRYVRVRLPDTKNAALTMTAVKVFDMDGNDIALNKYSTQSSTFGNYTNYGNYLVSTKPDGSPYTNDIRANAACANDGSNDSKITHTNGGRGNWWLVDLAKDHNGLVINNSELNFKIKKIEVYNRTGSNLSALEDHIVDVLIDESSSLDNMAIIWEKNEKESTGGGLQTVGSKTKYKAEYEISSMGNNRVVQDLQSTILDNATFDQCIDKVKEFGAPYFLMTDWDGNKGKCMYWQENWDDNFGKLGYSYQTRCDITTNSSNTDDPKVGEANEFAVYSINKNICDDTADANQTGTGTTSNEQFTNNRENFSEEEEKPRIRFGKKYEGFSDRQFQKFEPINSEGEINEEYNNPSEGKPRIKIGDKYEPTKNSKYTNIFMIIIFIVLFYFIRSNK